MNNQDEPLFDTGKPSAAKEFSQTTLGERIRSLVYSQPYAVLCVQGQGQPYGALVAIAFSSDLRQAVFVTPVTTRKFRLLSENDHLALVIDDRPNRTGDVMEIEAVTVTGRSRQLGQGNEFDRGVDMFVAKHPYLRTFARSESCALFRVDVVRYFHVARFQEVRQWIPTGP